MLSDETIHSEKDIPTHLDDDTVMEEATGADADEPLTPEEQLLKERQEWINHMRRKFCIQPDFEITKNMIHPDGTLNQE
jgi:hypothetical protein